MKYVLIAMLLTVTSVQAYDWQEANRIRNQENYQQQQLEVQRQQLYLQQQEQYDRRNQQLQSEHQEMWERVHQDDNPYLNY